MLGGLEGAAVPEGAAQVVVAAWPGGTQTGELGGGGGRRVALWRVVGAVRVGGATVPLQGTVVVALRTTVTSVTAGGE